jgi:TRAP-type C4-dicarboxylate transport system substrate-binding protein
MKLRTAFLATTALVSAAFLATGTAKAQEEINLTFIGGFPIQATTIGAFVQGYAPAVDAQLAKTGNYKINWNMAHSGQVVKPRGELEGVEVGLGDIGVVVTAFHADKVPLYEISYKTPFTTKNMDLVARTTKQLEGQFPQYAARWKEFNQMSLYPTGAVDNYLLVSKSPINKLADLNGRKVGAAGPNLPWVTAVGAAGVQTNLADAYNSLNTGIYDNMVVWAQAAGAFKLCEPAPNILHADLGAIQSNILNVNLDSLEAMPEEVRKAILDNAELWHVENEKRVVGAAKAMLERCRSEFGTKETTLSEADRKTWAVALPPLAKEWAERINGQGAPGTEILKIYMDTMRANNQPILRDWDRE